MSARRFARLTPGATLRLLDGYKAREEARYRRVAWQTAHLLNVSGKTLRSRVTAAKLLGLPDATEPPRPRLDDPESASDAGLDYVAVLNAALKGTDLRP